jgi:VWFA-related protein
MNSRTACLAALCWGNAVLAIGHLSSQQAPVFRSGTNLVRLDVSVRHSHAPVLHLTSEAFELRDDGVRQAIQAQPVDSVPLDVSLIFDRSHFGQSAIGAAFQHDLEQIIGLMRRDDRLQVITFATDVREIVAMQTPDELRQRPDLQPSSASASLKHHAGLETTEELDFLHDPQLNRSALFDALLFGLARPVEIGRRLLVIVFATGRNSGGVVGDAAIVRQVAARSDGVLYAGLWNGRYRYDPTAVAAVAQATGGAVENAADAVKSFKSIVESFRQSYVLQYSATGVALSGWHDVTVTVPGHPDYEIRARKGYMGR